MAVGRNVFIESAVRAVVQYLSVGSPCRDNFFTRVFVHRLFLLEQLKIIDHDVHAVVS